jgi:ubiquinone/menaquinone biosynthesis C-methylase UbiE
MELKNRKIGKEITDDLSLSDPEVIENLKELETINRYFGGHASSFYGIKNLLQKAIHRPVSVADFGCGGGDTLLYLKEKFNKFKNIEWIGFDGNNSTVEFARSKLSKEPDVCLVHGNFFKDEIRTKTFDIVHCALTCHHLEDAELVSLFRQLYQNTRIGFVINDLHRHWLSLAGVKLLNGIIIKTSIGKHDGLQSVRRGFTRNELTILLQKAGITDFAIHWRWAFRWLIIVKK